MRRYLVFAFDVYYPDGGANDFKCAFDKYEDALKAAKAIQEGQAIPLDSRYDVVQIFDTQTCKHVARMRGKEWA